MNLDLSDKLFGKHKLPAITKLPNSVIVTGMYHKEDYLDLIDKLNSLDLTYKVLIYDHSTNTNRCISNDPFIQNRVLPNIKVVDEVLNEDRMRKLSDLRNELLSDVLHYQYVIIQDFDLDAEYEDYLMLYESINEHHSYAGIMANGLLVKSSGVNIKKENVVTYSANTVVYNDASAYLDTNIDLLATGLYMKEGLHAILGGVIYKQISHKDDLLEVRSAFGGLAIYNSESIKNRRYDYRYGSEIVCEHIPFNLGLKLAINKYIIINY